LHWRKTRLPATLRGKKMRVHFFFLRTSEAGRQMNFDPC
jgi:hypothetical protein